ncbi:MAG TPA: gamma-glutamyl-gamma-aminobutyrate hydrolase family protein [Longimicrobiales bacterium]|nr:gamma-glutamyl-gamma-aminobutyrate hydrolase family protein [Longimicrobiales bacterium]
MILPVAVTTTIDARAGSHRQPAVFLYTGYLEALAQAGLTPLLLTPAHSADAIEAIVALSRGLLLTGGEDVAPERYGEAPGAALGGVVPERDALEWRALELALARDLPVLGICRGCQLLNVFFGGSLHQDLASDVPGGLEHRQRDWAQRSHDVDVVPGSRLRDVVGADRIRINSFHHQGVKRLAPALRAAARADDGLVEGVEAPGHRWVLGVQWHPERGAASAPDGDPDRRLFRAFRDAVAGDVD